MSQLSQLLSRDLLFKFNIRCIPSWSRDHALSCGRVKAPAQSSSESEAPRVVRFLDHHFDILVLVGLWPQFQEPRGNPVFLDVLIDYH